MTRKAVNIDELPAGVERDRFGFPVSLPTPPREPGSTLAEMTNQYQHVRGRWWTRAPKLKQQKRAIKVAATMQGNTDPLAIMDSLTEIAQQFLYIEEGGEQMRPATADEIDEEFDLAEVQALVGELTGMRPQEADPKN